MKYIYSACTALLFIAISSPVFCQSHLSRATLVTFSGKVIDGKSQLPIGGASVYFPDLRLGTLTNDSGFFIVRSVPAGLSLVEVSSVGYAAAIERLSLSGNTQKDFTLYTSVIENQTVTVIGVSSATSIKKTPIPVNVLKKEDLFKSTSTNLIDNLSKIPGVAQVSTGPAISKPFIRGLGYNRVIVVNDGIKQEGQQWGDEHGIEVDELNANKVEVLKGPASLTYGSDALAGVVNIISLSPAAEGHIKGEVLGGYQSNNRQRNFHASLDGNSNGFIWGINGTYKAAADYRNKFDGFVFNSKFNERDFGGYVGVNKAWGFSHLYITRFDQTLGLVEGDRDDATGQFVKLINDNGTETEVPATETDFKSIHPEIPRQRIQHTKLAIENSIRAGSGRITVTLGYQRNQRQEFGNILDPDEKALYFDLNTFNYNVQYHFSEKRNWRTTIGINGMQQRNQNKGMETLIPEYSMFDVGGFIYTQKAVKKLTFSGGVRYDMRSLNTKELLENNEAKFSPISKLFSNISGSAGLSYEASRMVTLKFDIARGFRAPTVAELSSNGAHEGTNRFEYGTADLKSETSLQTDLGIEIGSEHVSFVASLFYNPVSNFIYYRKLQSTGGGDSLITDGTNTFMAFKFDQQNARLYGAEFNLDIHPHPLDWLHIENTFSWVRGELTVAQDGSKNLPFIPAARLINEIKVDFAKNGKKLRAGFFALQLDNTFAQHHAFTGFDTETATPGYSLLNISAGADIMHKGRKLFTFFAGGNNLANVAYQSHLSRLKYAAVNLVTGRTGVYNIGRNISFKIDVPLDFVMKKG